MGVRRILFWAHLAVGVVAGLVILLLAATGVLLTYERQVTAWAEDRAVSAPAGRAPLGADALVAAAAARGAGPGHAVTFARDPAAAVRVGLGRRTAFLLDPHDGAALDGAGEGAKAFFGTVTALHRWLGFSGAGREAGAAVTGAATLGFLFMLVTGAVLWWPRAWRRQVLRARLVPRLGMADAKARDFAWHHVFGAWALVPLLAVVLSGVVIAYPWARDLLYRAHGEAPPAGRGARGGAPPAAAGPAGPLDAEAILATARAAAPEARRLTLRLPAPAAPVVEVVADSGNGAQPARQETLTIAREDARLLARRGPEAASPAARLRGFLRFLHTGEVFGWVGQTLAGLASLAAMVLVWTGLALAWRRLVRPLLAAPRRA